MAGRQKIGLHPWESELYDFLFDLPHSPIMPGKSGKSLNEFAHGREMRLCVLVRGFIVARSPGIERFPIPPCVIPKLEEPTLELVGSAPIAFLLKKPSADERGERSISQEAHVSSFLCGFKPLRYSAATGRVSDFRGRKSMPYPAACSSLRFSFRHASRRASSVTCPRSPLPRTRTATVLASASRLPMTRR